MSGAALPPGWLGKPWACAQLAAATDADVLVFVDADVRLAPGAVPAAVALLLAAGLDVVCPFPRQLAVTPAERLVQPLLQWSWLTTLPLRLAERSPRPSLTAACGQFLVVRRAALERAGGFAAVRAAVFDDLALVRAVKASGGRGGVVDGTALATCRMYASWPELRDGYGKSLWAAFGSPPAAVAVLAGLTLVYVVPPIAALRGSRAGLAGYLAAVASRVVAARATGGRAWPDAAGASRVGGDVRLPDAALVARAAARLAALEGPPDLSQADDAGGEPDRGTRQDRPLRGRDRRRAAGEHRADRPGRPLPHGDPRPAPGAAGAARRCRARPPPQAIASHHGTPQRQSTTANAASAMRSAIASATAP